MTAARAQITINPAQRRLRVFLMTAVILLAMSLAVTHAKSAMQPDGLKAHGVSDPMR